MSLGAVSRRCAVGGDERDTGCRLGKQLANPLNLRREVVVELPEFAVCAIECQVEEANADDPDTEEVTFNDVVEWLLVSEVTMKRMPLLEQSIPGLHGCNVHLVDGCYVPAGRRLIVASPLSACGRAGEQLHARLLNACETPGTGHDFRILRSFVALRLLAASRSGLRRLRMTRMGGAFARMPRSTPVSVRSSAS